MISYRNGVVIGQLAFYIPSFFIGVFLTIRHEFHTTGWLDIALFSLIRVIGSGMQVGTINNPTSTGLYTGSSILASIGVAPLVACALGLLNRLNESITQRHHHTILDQNLFRVIQTGNIVGLILGIVGGVKSGHNYGQTGVYTVQTITKVGTGLIIGAFAFVVLIDIYLISHVKYAKPGMKRLLLGVSLALPFLTVRVAYSILTSYTTDVAFHLIGGDTTDWLCVAVIEEVGFIVIVCAVGLCLRPAPKRTQSGVTRLRSIRHGSGPK